MPEPETPMPDTPATTATKPTAASAGGNYAESKPVTLTITSDGVNIYTPWIIPRTH